MNMDRLIKMILNRVIRTLVNKGVNGAINSVAGATKKGDQPNANAHEMQQKSKHAMRMARRAGKM